MNNPSIDSLPWEREPTFRWLVCARQQRWPRAVRRFAAELIPADRSLQVLVCNENEVERSLCDQDLGVVLWDVDARHLADACEAIAKTSLTLPTVLQLAVATDLAPAEQAALSELGVTAMLRHPEQLPKLGKLLGVYFAR